MACFPHELGGGTGGSRSLTRSVMRRLSGEPPALPYDSVMLRPGSGRPAERRAGGVAGVR